MQQILCSQCGFVAQGETKAEAMEKLAAHGGTAHAPAKMTAQKMDAPRT